MKTISQKNQILKYLMRGGKITPIMALIKYNCLRLGGRIFELRKEGWPVKSENYKLRSGKIVSRYFITNEDLIKIKKS